MTISVKVPWRQWILFVASILTASVCAVLNYSHDVVLCAAMGTATGFAVTHTALRIACNDE